MDENYTGLLVYSKLFPFYAPEPVRVLDGHGIFFSPDFIKVGILIENVCFGIYLGLVLAAVDIGSYCYFDSDTHLG